MNNILNTLQTILMLVYITQVYVLETKNGKRNYAMKFSGNLHGTLVLV